MPNYEALTGRGLAASLILIIAGLQASLNDAASAEPDRPMSDQMLVSSPAVMQEMRAIAGASSRLRVESWLVGWVASIGLDPSEFGTHYAAHEGGADLPAPLLLGHSKIEAWRASGHRN
jgi:hypothetical protein